MRLYKVLGWTAIGLGTLTALVGVAHTDLGRPLLRLLPSLAGCPANLDAADPTRVEAFRVRQLKARAGEAEAMKASAWHFELGSTRRSAVDTWAVREGVVCERARQDSLLRCQLPASETCANGRSTAHLQFDALGRLVAVDLLHPGTSADHAVEHVARVRQKLRREVGPETRASGKMTPQHLEARRFRHASVEYRYSAYVAKVSATNLGAGAVLVREQYQWLPPSES